VGGEERRGRRLGFREERRGGDYEGKMGILVRTGAKWQDEGRERANE
jgi:hypothetical protein